MSKTITALTTLTLALSCFLFEESAIAQKDSTIYDEGVVINGVKWATRNVDVFQTFAPTPESFGMLYQWNRKKAWNTIDKVVENWIVSLPTGTEWEKSDDPCPCGWRLPTLHEFELLINSNNTWTKVNNIWGRRFGSGDSTIFLPAVGYRTRGNGLNGRFNDTGRLGYYWSSTQYSSTNAHLLLFFYGNVDTGGVGSDKRDGYSVRCVSE
jgi:uncharacterized protein (TIGR02145 family)